MHTTLSRSLQCRIRQLLHTTEKQSLRTLDFKRRERWRLSGLPEAQLHTCKRRYFWFSPPTSTFTIILIPFPVKDACLIHPASYSGALFQPVKLPGSQTNRQFNKACDTITLLFTKRSISSKCLPFVFKMITYHNIHIVSMLFRSIDYGPIIVMQFRRIFLTLRNLWSQEIKWTNFNLCICILLQKNMMGL